MHTFHWQANLDRWLIFLPLYDPEKFKWQPFGGEVTPKGCVRHLGGGEQTLCTQNHHFKA